jgi:hypothetical protein
MCLALIPVAATATLLQERVWHSEEALWAHTVQVTPSSAVASFQLSVELARLKRPAESLRVCQDASRYHPDDEIFQRCIATTQRYLEMLKKHGDAP